MGKKLPIIQKRKSSSGEEPDAVAQAVGRESIKVSDCLPYLKCFNVEDIVNIRGHFSSQKYLSWYNGNKQQIMKEKGNSKNQWEADGCSQDGGDFLVFWYAWV